MQQCIFLFADEAVVPQDKRAENVLKAMITEPTFNVEPKFVNGFRSRTCCTFSVAPTRSGLRR